MRYPTIAAMTFALALAACSDGEEDKAGSGKTVSTEEVAEKARDLVKPEPGLYRSTVELLEVDIPGAPDGAADMMKGMMGTSNSTSEYCLTQADVDRGFEEMIKNSQKGDCTFERFEAEGGEIDAVMNCTAEGGNTMHMTMQGTGGATSSEMTMNMETEMPGMGKTNMRMTAKHQRIGDCAG
jgi:putative hemolysin